MKNSPTTHSQYRDVLLHFFHPDLPDGTAPLRLVEGGKEQGWHKAGSGEEFNKITGTLKPL